MSHAATPTVPYSSLGYFPSRGPVGAIAVDPATHDVYAASDHILTDFDPPSTTILHTTAIAGSGGLAIDPADSATFVSASSDQQVGVVNGDTGDFLQNIPVGYEPQQIVLDSATHKLYVADKVSGSGHDAGVSVVDESNGDETATIPIAAGAVALALDPASDKLYVADATDGDVTVIDTTTNTVTDTIDLGIGASPELEGIAIDPSADKVWVTSAATGDVVVINEYDDSINATIPVGYSAWGIGINPDQGMVFVAEPSTGAGQPDTGTIAILNEDNGSLISTISVGGTTQALAVDPDEGRVYVADISSARVYMYGVNPNYGTGTLSFDSSTYTIAAGSPVTIRVDRVGDPGVSSTVNYSTSAGTGTAGVDYVSTSGTITFPAGADYETFTVPTIKHGSTLANPTVNLTLTNPVNGTLRYPQTSVITLREMTPPLLADQSPPDTASLGEPYSYTFTATGSPSPGFAVASGHLPAGLQLDATTGEISGTPTASGPSTFTINANNGANTSSSTQPITMTVHVPPAFTAESPTTTATEGDPSYTYQYVATGDPAPTYSIASGSLPSGLKLSAPDGTISGTPRGPGVFTFQIKASNGFDPDAVSDPATITVTGAPVTPDSPAITGVTAGNGQATVAFTAPYDGGDAISGYTVTAMPGGETATGASGPLTVTGLTNGTSYTFSVTATNGIGTSLASAPSGPVRPAAPVIPATVLRTAASASIAAGKKLTVSATLSDEATRDVAPGQTVKLLARTSTTHPFTKVATLTTSSTGVAKISEKPTHDTQYEFSYAGSPSHASSASGVQQVWVGYVVSIALKAKRVSHTKKAELWGTVSPAVAGNTVDIQEKIGSHWRTIKTLKLKKQKLPNHKKAVGFIYSIAKASKGSYGFRVIRPASATNVAGTSPIVKLTRT